MESPDRNEQPVGLRSLKVLVAQAPKSFSQARSRSRDAWIGDDSEGHLVEILADMVHSALACEESHGHPVAKMGSEGFELCAVDTLSAGPGGIHWPRDR